MPYKDAEKKRATGQEYTKRPEIKQHRSAYHKVYRQNPQTKERLNARERKRRIDKRAQCLIAHARIRARRLNVPFDLNIYTDILQQRIDNGICELTGIQFDLEGGKRKWASPSIDRIKPSDGYVIENIRVICFGMNAALGNWGIEPLLEMISGLIKNGNAIVPQLAAVFVRAFLDTESTDPCAGNGNMAKH
jgi:hypothetical protein